LTRRPEVAYGSTLLAVAATARWIAYLQLGDGDILAVDEKGTTSRPVPGDPKLIGNRTSSLCQEDAAGQLRVRVESEMPALITLSTDGYANGFQTDADFLQIGPDYLQMVQSERDGLGERLPAILGEATRQGSCDDITLILLVRNEARKNDKTRTSKWRRMLAAFHCASAGPENYSLNLAGLTLGGPRFTLTGPAIGRHAPRAASRMDTRRSPAVGAAPLTTGL
jgi:hypothetical protein